MREEAFRYVGRPCKDCARETTSRFTGSDPVRCWACEARWTRHRAFKREQDALQRAERNREVAQSRQRADEERRRKAAFVLTARREGRTYTSIARSLGLSVERVRQIAILMRKRQEAGYPPY